MSAAADEGNHRATRRHVRQQVLIAVKFRRKGEAWFRSKITDLSPAGFRLLSFVKLKIGMEVWVMFSGFDGRRARVIWAANHEAGCVFEAPLHPAIYDHILRTSTIEIRG